MTLKTKPWGHWRWG